MLIEWKDLRCAFDGRTIFEVFSGLLAVFAAKSITIALAMELAVRGNRLAPELK